MNYFRVIVAQVTSRLNYLLRFFVEIIFLSPVLWKDTRFKIANGIHILYDRGPCGIMQKSAGFYGEKFYDKRRSPCGFARKAGNIHMRDDIEEIYECKIVQSHSASAVVKSTRQIESVKGHVRIVWNRCIRKSNVSPHSVSRDANI